MQSVDAWEVRGLQIFCLLVLMTSGLAFFYEVFHPSSSLAANLLQFGGPLLMLITGAAGFVMVSPQRYNFCVGAVVVCASLGLWMLFLADAVDHRFTGDDSLVTGRVLEHAFLMFPSLAILGLFLVRLWAVVFWVAINLAAPVLVLSSASSFEHISFTYDMATLVADGNAINADILEKERNVAILFGCALLGLAGFHRWALRSSVTLEKTKENYRRFFSPEIGEEIEAGEIVVGRQGSREADVAVLFTDIAGFTKLSEKMDPQDVLNLLSAYQTLMVDAIFQHKGTVDKFIGDAVMANFGTPRSHGNDAQNAFDCGVLMNQKLDAWNEERQAQGLPVIQHRIGIHFGKCVVGNMGSEQRLEFAVIGDAVNVASRICDACKNFDTNFLISAEMAGRITHELPSEDLPNVGIRGREGSIDLVKISTDPLVG
tara:strand:- start:416 stop:1702 length:1287 start_codon:yes stop_codon:yes gene_type:complete